MAVSTLKLITYNIHKGFSFRNTHLVLDLIKQSLRETQADLVFLQEVVGENQRHQNDYESWPKSAQFEYLADEVWAHYAYGKNAVYLDGHHGNAILSKYPIEFFQNIDLSTNPLEQRGLLHAQIHLPDQNLYLDLFNTHLNLMHRERKKQAQKISSFIQKELSSSRSFILAGDFNDWNQKLSREFEQGLGTEEAFRVARGAYAKSFPSFLPLLRLDRVYFRGLKVKAAYRLHGKPWSQLSDHLALFTEFLL